MGAVYAVVLAAGQSERFGGDKLLAVWQGRPLLWHVLGRVRNAIEDGNLAGGCVVLPPQAPALTRLARDAGIVCLSNPSAASGLGSSIRVGLDWLTLHAGEGPSAAAIFLGDQPATPSDVVSRLIAAWGDGGRLVVRPRYADAPDEPGHPILVDRALWSLASELTGDTGFGPLLAARGIPAFMVDTPGRNPDVDTPTDLTDLERSKR